MESGGSNPAADPASGSGEPSSQEAPTRVGSAAELSDALRRGELDILVEGTITHTPMLTLPPGVTLRGGVLRFGGRGIKVTTVDGGPVGIGKGLIRALVAYVSGFALGIGLLWMIWDSKKQTWHDKAAGTVVVAAYQPWRSPTRSTLPFDT